MTRSLPRPTPTARAPRVPSRGPPNTMSLHRKRPPHTSRGTLPKSSHGRVWQTRVKAQQEELLVQLQQRSDLLLAPPSSPTPSTNPFSPTYATSAEAATTTGSAQSFPQSPGRWWRLRQRSCPLWPMTRTSYALTSTAFGARVGAQSSISHRRHTSYSAHSLSILTHRSLMR